MLSSFNVQSIIAAVLVVFLLFYSPTHSPLTALSPALFPSPSPNAVSAVLVGVIQSLTHASSSSPSLFFSCGGNVNENGFIKPGKYC